MASVIKLSSPGTQEYWEIPVLFADDHLLAIHKPARLLTSPDRYDPERPNLMRLLHRAIAQGAPWTRELGVTYLANAHRLDFQTSGVLLLARSKPVLVALVDQFGTGKPRKIYAALVTGQPAEDRFEVNAPLAPHPAHPGRMRVDLKHGRKCRTLFEIRERFRGYSLLTGQPLTGRTHQVRAHLWSVRLPLVADALYGGHPLLLSRLKPGYRPKPDVEEQPLIGRVALHAESLALVHPVVGQPLQIHCPWPKDLQIALKYLRKFAALP